MLSDNGIRDAIHRGAIGIEPFREEALQPASLDVHLSDVFYGGWKHAERIDPYEDNSGIFDRVQAPTFIVYPGDLIIACTQEVVRLGDRYGARVEGKSSLGRLGLSIHTTAGFIDPGFHGQVTLEITSVHEFKLYAGMPIGQLAFFEVTGGASRGYGGRYQGQDGPVLSRFHVGRERPKEDHGARNEG